VNAFRTYGPRTLRYFAVRCAKCQTPIPFALDRSDEGGERPVQSTAKLILTCSDACGHKADYTAAAVFRVDARPSKPGGRPESLTTAP
jgi:hypothetical protein